MLQAWLNGTFVPMTEATVSAFDAGFQHGVGLFETMAARHGRIFRGLEHMERMRTSAKELGLADTLREMREDLQSSISYAGGRVLTDLKKVNYVVLGGENAGEHLFM